MDAREMGATQILKGTSGFGSHVDASPKSTSHPKGLLRIALRGRALLLGAEGLPGPVLSHVWRYGRNQT